MGPVGEPQGGKLKKWLLRAAFVLLGPILVLAIVEVVWIMIGDPRIAESKEWLAKVAPHSRLGAMGIFEVDDDPEVSFRLKPKFTAKIGDQKYTINSEGNRGPELISPRRYGTKRIVVLGDSYAFGYGVDDADTIPMLLEKKLEEKVDRLEVINLGVPGYHTGQEAKHLERAGFKHRPNLVVLVYYPNDNITGELFYNPRLKYVYVDEMPLPYGVKHLLGRSIIYSRLTKSYTQYLMRNGHLDYKGLRHWPVTQERIKRIAAACKEREVPFMIVALPTLSHSRWLIDATHPTSRDHERLIEFLKTELIPVVDFREFLVKRGKPIEDLHVSKDPPDSHLNAEGNRYVVDELMKVIVREKVFEDDRAP